MMALPVAVGRRKLVLDITGTLGTKVLLLPLSMLSSVIVARVLQPEGKGIYSTVLTLVELLLSIGSIGIGKAVIYHLGRGEHPARELRSAAFWLTGANGLLLSLVVVLLALLAAPVWLADIPPTALLVAAPLGLVSVLRLTWEGFLRGEQRNHAVNLVAVVYAVALLAGLAGAGLIGRLDPHAALGMRVLAAAVAAAVAVVLVGLPKSGVWPLPRARLPAGALVAFGVPYAVSGLLTNLNYNVDILLIQHFLANAQVGYYSTSAGLAELLWYLPSAAGFVLFPRVSGLSARTAAEESAATLRWTVAITVGGALAFFVLAEPLIALLYGAAYLPAVPPLRLLLAGIVANTWYQVLSGYLAGRGVLRVLLAVTLAGVVANIGLNLLLIPTLGIEGAAIASTVSYSVNGFLTLLYFVRLTSLPWRQALLPLPEDARVLVARLRRSRPGREQSGGEG